MRNAFAHDITELAHQNDRIVLLSGDIGNRLFDSFKEAFPDRFYNCGVAEANMIGVAAGLALSGFRPVCYTIAPFVTYRCLEQIRIDLCYHDLPVVIVGTGAGLSYASLGATHHSCEEMGMLRLLPNMVVLAPADSVEVQATLRAALDQSHPTYIRIGKKGEAAVHPAPLEHYTIGRFIPLRAGADVCLLSCGTPLAISLGAAELLQEKGLQAEVFSCPSVKPFDQDLLKQLIARHSLIVTIEEHSRLGGFGGSIAEWLTDQYPTNTKLLRMGTADHFYHHIGSQKDARLHYGLTSAQIAETILCAKKGN